MKNRIFKHYITTILGVVLLFTTLFLVWIGKTTITDASLLITLASALILSKHNLFRNTPNNEQ